MAKSVKQFFRQVFVSSSRGGSVRASPCGTKMGSKRIPYLPLRRCNSVGDVGADGVGVSAEENDGNYWTCGDLLLVGSSCFRRVITWNGAHFSSCSPSSSSPSSSSRRWPILRRSRSLDFERTPRKTGSDEFLVLQTRKSCSYSWLPDPQHRWPQGWCRPETLAALPKGPSQYGRKASDLISNSNRVSLRDPSQRPSRLPPKKRFSWLPDPENRWPQGF